jgi:hypothetical protein
MTHEELEKLGFFFIGNKINPILYTCSILDAPVKIPDYYKINNILAMIYDKGKEAGVELGEENKIEEIKNCLNL